LYVRVIALALLVLAPAASALQLDSFLTQQSVTGPENASPVTGTVSSPAGALDGTRTLLAFGDAIPSDSVSVSIDEGLLTVGQEQPSGQPSSTNGQVIWTPVNPLDLTDGGVADSFFLTVVAQTQPVVALIIVNSGGACAQDFAGLYCGAAMSDLSVALNGQGTYRFRFSDFELDGFFQADFTRAEWVELGLRFADDVPAGSIQVGPVFTAPEPSALGLLGLAALALCSRRR
jgi:PEP-CTERM motif-containing protein